MYDVRTDRSTETETGTETEVHVGKDTSNIEL